MELTIDQALQKGIKAHKAGQVQKADRLYTAILKVHPKNPDANHNMGVLAVGLGKVQEALPFFKTALEANPATAQFWLSYIDALVKLNKLAAAKAVLDQAKDNGAKGAGFDELVQRLKGLVDASVKVQAPPQDQVESILNLYNQGQLAAAVEQAQSLTEQYPEAFIVWNILGAAHKGLGKIVEASRAFKKVTELNPNYADGYSNFGVTLKDQGKLKEAIDACNKALAIKPDYAEAHYNMGIVFMGQGKLEEAIEAYNKALAIKPGYADAWSNIGSALQDQGKLEEAVEAYNKALAIKPDYAESWNNMGAALQDQGKLEEAVEAYNRAIDVKPDCADAYNNMGNALQEQGKLKEAIEAYKKTIAIKPNYASAYNNMGNALQEQGKLKEAIEAYKKMIAIKPDYAEAYYNMGNALQEEGKLGESINVLSKAIAIKPHYAEAYNNMVIALKDVVFNQPNPDLQKAIGTILDHKTYVRPTDISSAAISLLKFEPVLQKILKRNSKSQLIQSPEETVLNLSELPLLLKLMAVCPLADLELEGVLTAIRSGLLSSILELEGASEVSNFQSALALQCFTNEYVYDQSDREGKALEALQVSVKRLLSNGEQPNPQSILCLASYKALHEYEWCNLITITNDIEAVFTRQVIEPQKEGHLKFNIPELTEITDKVSSKVRDQYEESPYPRWVNLGLPLAPTNTLEMTQETKLKLFDNTLNEVEAPNILIAGCGTGQHSIGTATRFKNSKVLAIDLSLSSLAYAKRKTEELGVQNIEYIQADILDLGNLDRQFDIVESAGVLHHMSKPMAGWKVLTDCLRPGGLMKIGLYSELARKHIVEIQEEINQLGIGSSNIEMKFFRNSLINSDKYHHKWLQNSPDFYSLSTLRDLLFHVQEHRFTLPQIQDCLNELGLKFCGFEMGRIVQNFKLNNIGADDPYDLDNWNYYEEANPGAFASMYQFWCQKIA